MSFTVVIVNNTAEFPFKDETLLKIPHLAQRWVKGEQIRLDSDYDIKFAHLSLLAKVVDRMHPITMVDCTSHADVYTTLLLARSWQITDESLIIGFGNWTEQDGWVELWHTEVLYQIHITLPELVDFKRYFRFHKKPFKNLLPVLPDALAQPTQTAQPTTQTLSASEYIDMLDFFTTYDLSLCFDGNNDEVQTKIELLKKDRKALWKQFMIDPHTPYLADYFKHRICTLPVWSCTGISALPEPVIGDNSLCDFETATLRVAEFTHNQFTDKVVKGTTVKFPHANVIFAGGAMAKLLAHKYDAKNARQSDVDLFIFAPTFAERSKVFEQVINWFDTFNTTKTTYYALRGSVTTIYIKDLPRKFQIISMNSSTPYDVIGHFDTTHIQWCLWEGRFYGTAGSCLSMCDKVTRFNNTGKIKMERLIKALHCGYSIHKNERVLEVCDISKIIEDPESMQLKKMIRDLYGWYYPVSNNLFGSNGMDSEEELQHILCMIEKDANATIVTNNPIVVFNNITISGNFENDYESILYSTFNPVLIVARPLNNGMRRVRVRSKHGDVRLTTNIMKVTSVTNTDQGVEIKVTVEDAFREFCTQLETTVFHMFAAGNVNKHVLTDGILTFEITRYQIEMQQKSGVSCFRTQRGAALNIEEDLHVGDDIQVLFSVDLRNENGERWMSISPKKFVKFQKYDAETKVEIVDPEVEAYVATDAEIEYEDAY
jgi:hypothetical protein